MIEHYGVIRFLYLLFQLLRLVIDELFNKLLLCTLVVNNISSLKELAIATMFKSQRCNKVIVTPLEAHQCKVLPHVGTAVVSQ